jgi:hypothetical protein
MESITSLELLAIEKALSGDLSAQKCIEKEPSAATKAFFSDVFRVVVQNEESLFSPRSDDIETSASHWALKMMLDLDLTVNLFLFFFFFFSCLFSFLGPEQFCVYTSTD